MSVPSDHHHPSPRNERQTGLAALLIAGFMGVEVAGGLISGSLALLADAVHMATDALSLALAWWAFVQARKPADAHRTYGYTRVQVLAAFANGLGLAAVIVWIILEAVGRLMTPQAVEPITLLVIATLGLLVNIAAFWVLSQGERDNLNIRGAMVHVLGDLLGSVAAIVGGIVILSTGWTGADALLSLAVAALLARSAWGLLRDSGRILLEAAPKGLDVREVALHVRESVPGVVDVHHVHAWMLTKSEALITLHVVTSEPARWNDTIRAVRETVESRFGVQHVTVQLETARNDPDLPKAEGPTAPQA